MAFHGFPLGCGAREMDGYVPAKMKRKDLEEVYDEFSEFSLSSPVRKIRRLVREHLALSLSLYLSTLLLLFIVS